MSESIYDFKATSINGVEHALKEYQGKVILIVNTASKCGHTPQFKGLESLYEQYKDQGLVILGFPSNQFLQDPSSNEEISEFCQLNYNVSFPMFAKIEVNGKNTDPLYKYLKSTAKGFAGSESIKWNFTKFLINKEGKVVKRFAPIDQPDSIKKYITELL